MASHLSPRQRMVRSAALLIRERGVQATSFSDVLAHSRAPRGSIYHHFPQGKAQLVEEATRWAGRFIADLEARASGEDDPLAGLQAAIDSWREILVDSDFGAGCPIAAVTVEGDDMPRARAAAAEAFQSWVDPYAKSLERHGVARARARSLATLTVSAIEGALLLARAQRSLAPLDRVADELRAAVQEALR
jgi:TetR/AcrR family transcriptional repressor of lmrAB and yxaGH operons